MLKYWPQKCSLHNMFSIFYTIPLILLIWLHFRILTDILAGYEYSDNFLLFPAYIWIDNGCLFKYKLEKEESCLNTFFDSTWAICWSLKFEEYAPDYFCQNVVQ